MRINVSFKKNEESLYKEIAKYSDKSAYIKECIKFYLNRNGKVETKESTPTNEDLTDILI